MKAVMGREIPRNKVRVVKINNRRDLFLLLFLNCNFLKLPRM